MLVAAAGHASVGFFLVLYLQQVRGWSAIATTAALLPFLALLLPAGLVAARLVTRYRPPALAATGLVTAAIGLALIGRLTAGTPYAGTLLAGLLVFPVGAALTFAAATVLAVTGAGPGRAGLAGGLVNTAFELGPTLGLAVLVSVAGTRTAQLLDDGHPPATATSGGYAVALTVAAASLLVAAVGTVAANHRTHQPKEGPQ